MRAFYLHPRDPDDRGGCRGGVGNKYLDSNDYELEIGQNADCSFEMLALCVLYDEIMEHLGQSGPIGELIFHQHKQLVNTIEKRFSEKRQEREQAI